jgi:hypothetical protein
LHCPAGQPHNPTIASVASLCRWISGLLAGVINFDRKSRTCFIKVMKPTGAIQTSALTVGSASCVDRHWVS